MMLIRMWSIGLWRWGYLGTSVTPILIAAERHRGTTGSLRGLTWNIGAWRSNYYPKKLIIALFSPPPDPAVMMMMMKDRRFLWRWFLCRPVARNKVQTYPENIDAMCSRCVCTGLRVVVNSLHALATKMYIMAVFSSSDFHRSYFSMMEWVEHILHCYIHEVCFNDEIIIGFLKMWPNLVDQKYADCNSNIWLYASWLFSPQ